MTDTPDVDSHISAQIPLIVVMLACILVIALLILFCHKLKKRKLTDEEEKKIDNNLSVRHTPDIESTNETVGGINSAQENVGILEHRKTSLYSGLRKEIVIGESMFDFEDEAILGKGYFGEVSKVRIKNSNQFVALKKLQTDSSDEAFNCLKQEISIMSRLKYHPNLVNLIGSLSVDDHKEWLVIEFCDFGDLKNYLRDHIKSLISANDDSNMNSRWLLRWAYEITVGMRYLEEEEGIVHGDLAARNIMMQSNSHTLGGCPVAKVADFGLADTFYSYPHNLRKAEQRMAWRWAAYEFISDGSIGLKSDIWSFGVLFWEILALGEIIPYLDQRCCTEEFKEKLQNGIRLQCPRKIKQVKNWFPHSPEKLFKKVSALCFKLEPEKRSSFKTIGELIAENLVTEEIQMYKQFYEEWNPEILPQALFHDDTIVQCQGNPNIRTL